MLALALYAFQKAATFDVYSQRVLTAIGVAITWRKTKWSLQNRSQPLIKSLLSNMGPRWAPIILTYHGSSSSLTTLSLLMEKWKQRLPWTHQRHPRCCSKAQDDLIWPFSKKTFFWTPGASLARLLTWSGFSSEYQSWEKLVPPISFQRFMN